MSDFNGASGGGAAPTCLSETDDSAASFSNFATLTSDQAHTIAAPGVCILSTWKGGGYNTISGTSMATPHVTGVAARCIASGPCAGLTASQIIAKLRADAAAQPTTYGFTGDLGQSSVPGKYYGHLVHPPAS
jgi:subtilisin family serine protease